MTSPLQTWRDLTAAEPRLVVLLESALAAVDPHGDHHAEHVYVLCKPLTGWLTGPDRGRPPKSTQQLPPPGTQLRKLFDTARPFPADGPLCDGAAYDLANQHLHAALHERQQLLERQRAALHRLSR